MGQLGLEGMPRRLFACTPTRLTTWLDCPQRYRMTYLDRPTPPRRARWAHNTIGTAVHLALRAWWDLPAGRRAPAAVRLLVQRAWTGEGFRDPEQAAAALAAAQEMAERYLAGVDPAAEPVGLERTVATRTARLALSGRVDRIDDDGGELVIVDYKTGRHVLTTDDARGSLALALYAVAAARTLRRPSRRVELHHLPTGDVLAWEHTDATLARQVARAEDIADEAQAAEEAFRESGDLGLFPARPGPLCGWCDFRDVCEAGRDAAPARDPWAAVALVG